jgi:hypothetical protein
MEDESKALVGDEIRHDFFFIKRKGKILIK